jgi:hypothetical protein
MRTAAICPTCATYENAICVLYDGPYLPCTGISPLDSIAEALAKIDAAICALGGTTTTSTTSTTTTAGPTTTTTTTTVNSCTAPVITDITTNGAYPQAAVTVYYDLNGIVDVLSVIISYSLDPNFESGGFNDTISNLNLTSYTIPDFTGSSTWYFRIRKVCGTDPQNPTGESYSNVVSIVPQPTTTTTTTTATPTTTTTTTTTGYVQNAILGIQDGTLAPYNSLEDACGDSAPVELNTYTFPNRQSIGIGVTLYVLPSYDPISSSYGAGWYRYWYTTLNNVSTPINPPQYIYIDETGAITDISLCPATTTTTTTLP